MSEEEIRETATKLGIEVDETMGTGKLTAEIFGETREGDHGTVVGLMASADSTHSFYDDLFTMIDTLKK